MEISVMVEAQAGVYWQQWKALARAVEALGFDGLYRSDHFSHGRPPAEPALELWVSLTWLATHTQRIAFGPLVTPAAFRHPAVTAWCALQVDDLSGRRLRLGVGAGWNAEEHARFGFPLLDIEPRFRRFQEYLEVVTRLIRSDEPASYSGDFYSLREAALPPRPSREGGPPITIGGNGPRRTLPLVARYADEWNCFWQSREGILRLSARLDELLDRQGRQPGDVRRTMMTGVFFGRDDLQLQEAVTRAGRDPKELRANGALVGTPGALRAQLAELAELGLDGVMLQWLDVEHLDRLEALAKAVL